MAPLKTNGTSQNTSQCILDQDLQVRQSKIGLTSPAVAIVDYRKRNAGDMRNALSEAKSQGISDLVLSRSSALANVRCGVTS